MRHFLGIAQFIVFDLVKIDTLSELVSFTEGDNRHFVLTRDIGYHGGAHLGDDATIAKHIARSDENFICAHNEGTNTLD